MSKQVHEFPSTAVVTVNDLLLVQQGGVLKYARLTDSWAFGSLSVASLTVTGSLTATAVNFTFNDLTINGAALFNGNVTLGDAVGDSLTVNPNAVTWAGNPTHSGNHTLSGNLTVQGSATLNGAVTLGDAAGDALTVNGNAVTWAGNPTHSGNHVFSGNLTVQGNTTIGNASGDTLTVHPNAVTWQNNPTHSGAHTFSGAVTIAGTLTPQGLVDISGASAGQVQFPATQNASSGVNVLDDYEEGTFTPVLQGGTTAGSQTYDIQTGRYVKIGKLVFVEINVDLSAKDGATSGSMQIGGFPFTIETAGTLSAGSLAIGRQSNWDLNTAGGFYAVGATLVNNTTRADLSEIGDNVVVASLTAADFGSDSRISCSGCYTATA